MASDPGPPVLQPTETAQSAVIAFLGDSATHGAPVARATTHISHVFLAGNRVYKLKRAVVFPFLDFTWSSVGAPRARPRSRSTVGRRRRSIWAWHRWFGRHRARSRWARSASRRRGRSIGSS
jgi:hypothetical protein